MSADLLPIANDTVLRAKIALVRNLIYDVGAHEDEDTGVFILEKVFSVVAVEANLGPSQKLATKFAPQVSTGKLRLLNAAIAEYDGTMEFHINEKLSVCTTDPVRTQRDGRLGVPSSIV
jgi:hypothetical protein